MPFSVTWQRLTKGGRCEYGGSRADGGGGVDRSTPRRREETDGGVPTHRDGQGDGPDRRVPPRRPRGPSRPGRAGTVRRSGPGAIRPGWEGPREGPRRDPGDARRDPG